jgi:hypothetical protein
MAKNNWRRESSGSLTYIWPNGAEWTFSRPGKSYIYCDYGRDDRTGTLGNQITYANGQTCYADTQEEFEQTVKDWMTRYLKKAKEHGETYSY